MIYFTLLLYIPYVVSDVLPHFTSTKFRPVEFKMSRVNHHTWRVLLTSALLRKGDAWKVDHIETLRRQNFLFCKSSFPASMERTKNAGSVQFRNVRMIQPILCHNSPKLARTIIVPNMFRNVCRREKSNVSWIKTYVR